MSGTEKSRHGIPALCCIVLAMALCLSFLGGCGQSQQTETLSQETLLADSQPAQYKTMLVERTEYTRTITANGKIWYPVKTDLRWEQENSYIAEVCVIVGQQVKAGDVLISFDVEMDQVQLETLRLQLNREKEERTKGKTSRQAGIDAAKQTLAETPQEDSYAYAIAALQVESLQAEYNAFVCQADRKVGQLEKQIAQLWDKAENKTLVAPYDGVIEAVCTYKPGDKVEPGQTLVSMYAIDTFYIEITNTPEVLRINTEVTVSNVNLTHTKEFTGRVIASPEILPEQSGTDLVLVQLDEAADLNDFKQGIVVTAQMESLEDVILLDPSMIRADGGQSYVNILDGESVRKSYVVTKRIGGKIWILDGLEEGQLLIVD